MEYDLIEPGLLEEVPWEKQFWTHDGRVIRAIEDMEEIFKTMDDNVFAQHVNDWKNDFAKWVREVVGDEVLADELIKTKDRKSSISIVKKRVRKIKREMRIKSEGWWKTFLGDTIDFLGTLHPATLFHPTAFKKGFVFGLVLGLIIGGAVWLAQYSF
ncbi:MAG: hypothetical protein ABIB71_03815 [Candidatus Woesearchaeota archaeon]